MTTQQLREALERISQLDCSFERHHVGEAVEIARAALAASEPQPQCIGYPGCDGDLEGEEHYPECPLHNPEKWAKWQEANKKLEESLRAAEPRPQTEESNEEYDGCPHNPNAQPRQEGTFEPTVAQLLDRLVHLAIETEGAYNRERSQPAGTKEAK